MSRVFSRVWSPRPNLEHLRNQAKDLLREWQRDRPDAQLADAQHAIARDYGFASWPKLKAHVESVMEERAAPVPAVESPFSGTWIANLAESTRHPAQLFQRATLRLAVDGNAMTITQCTITASGEEENSRHVLQIDGEEHAGDRSNRYALVARWLGPRVVETVARRAGHVVGAGTYEVSADGLRLTVSAAAPSANADGWRSDAAQTIVFDRAAGDGR
jgi:hypothetical protein